MNIYDFLYVLRCCTLYYSYPCSYGPKDKRGDDAYKRRGLFVKKRGCQCNLIIKVLNQSPHIEILTYNTYDNEDEDGWPYHSPHDTSGDARALHCPKLSRDIVSCMECQLMLHVKCKLSDMWTYMLNNMVDISY